MKKIVILLILFPLCVHAKVYTFEKEEFLSNLIYPDSDEIKFVDKTILYNTYIEEKVDLGYLRLNYEYDVDLNDFVRTSYFYECDFNNNSYQIKNSYNTQIQYFSMLAVEGDYNISEIEIYKDDIKINYTATSYDSYSEILNDGKFDETINVFNRVWYFKLEELVDLNNLEIIIYSDDLSEHYINILDDNNPDDIFFYTRSNRIYFNDFLNSNNYYCNDSSIFYKHYSNEKVNTGVYVADGDNLDYADFIIEYKYKKYDVIKVYDDVSKLDNLIEYTNFPIEKLDVVYDDNIYYKTGIYEVIINLNEYTFTVEYEVNYEDYINDAKEEMNTKDEENLDDKVDLNIYDTKEEIKDVIVSIPIKNNVSNVTLDISEKEDIIYDEIPIIDSDENNFIKDYDVEIKNDTKKINKRYMMWKRKINYILIFLIILNCIVLIILYIRKKSKDVERV